MRGPFGFLRGVSYMHGEWCGPRWREAAALDAELRSAPEFVALQESAARAPLRA